MSVIASRIGRLAVALLPLAIAGTVVTAPSAQAATFTLQDVQQHASGQDCWSIVSGNVYDLTSWIGLHPGGQSTITAMCGRDATASYVSQHSRESSPAKALARYLIGTLSGSSTPPPTTSTYTMTEVAAHNSATNCWSVVSGGVYDLSTWGPNHPGGASVITAMCGKDGTAGFLGTHSGTSTKTANAVAALASFKIGTLSGGSSTPPPPTPPTALGSYTLAQVATHSTATDCWSAVSSSVYNLTAWIGQHPGGQSTIIAMCGKDATASFVGKHSGSAGANTALALYKIGTLTGATATVTASGSYTLAQVATHSTATDCWSAVSSSVYNLTTWIGQHPGGQSTILAMCGIDATDMYLGKHHLDAGPASSLALYKIGTLLASSVQPVAVTSPAATPVAVPQAKRFTMKQVRAHHTSSRCWSTANSSVYNFSRWTKAHPKSALVQRVCGRNSTKFYNARFGGVAKASTVLRKYHIGALGSAIPAPAQPSTTPAAPAAGTYTLAQVATHSTAADCWSVVNGSVYDLAKWVSRHPGGSGTITGMCGKDATTSFLGKHSGSASANAALAPFKIGAIA